MSETDELKFFKRVVLNYICKDISFLRNVENPNAGPLLACVVNGIDVMGGVCDGFGVISTKRSTDFLINHMSVSSDVADVIYCTIRCGIAHEGGPKLGLEFFVPPNVTAAKNLLYRRGDSTICLDVLALAVRFEDAVATVKNDPSLAANKPLILPKDTRSVEAIKFESLPRYEDFCELLRPPETSSTPSDYQLPSFKVEPASGAK